MEEKDYQARIKELEQENILLRKQNLDIESVFGEVMEKISYPLVLTRKEGAVKHYNYNFVDILDFDARDKAKDINGFTSTPLRELVSENLYGAIREVAYSDEKATKIIDINGLSYMLNVYEIKGGEYYLISLRSILDNQLSKEELYAKLQDVIQRNMKMVQNIGFVMGEETASLTSVLNSIIKDIRK